MALLILGLVLFLGIHCVPMLPGMRTRLVAGWGEDGYKIRFSVAAGLGLVLLIAGYAVAPAGPRLFTPHPHAILNAPTIMVPAFILLAAANMRGHLRRVLRHPMLIGVLLWSGMHLAANGTLRATLLFGAFLAWAVIDIVSASLRGATASFVPQARFDAMAIVGGSVAALAFMAVHRLLIGVKVVPWGL